MHRSTHPLTNAYAYPLPTRIPTKTSTETSFSPPFSSASSTFSSDSAQAHPPAQATPDEPITMLSWTSTAPTSYKSSAETASSNSGSTSSSAKSVRHKISRVWGRLRHNNSKPSASQSPQPSRTLPELPPELWILILEYSTYPSSPEFDSPFSAPSALPSLELPSSFLSPALTPASLAPRLACYRITMAHKRSLALVSKQWNQYAQPVLYAAIWITRAAQAKALALTLLCQACCLPPNLASTSSFHSKCNSSTRTSTSSTSHTDASVGRFIRRLHIETPSLERCAPADLRSILAYAPGLEVYSDFRSVRLRPPGAPAELLGALAKGGALKRLSWTNYDDPALVGLGVGLGMPMMGLSGGIGVGHMGGLLEYLELNFVSSAVSPSPSSPHKFEAGAALALSLPALKTLKVALDNATFAVLSTWDLPALRNLSVLSADFSYAREGFGRFFAVHGRALRQLELGHSSAHIEEHYLTAPPPPAAAGAAGGGVNGAGTGGLGGVGMSLAEWCPNLEEFVCSADAAWDWTHPDWIAPHLLLPAHPTVTLIGIRGTDARLRDDYARHADADGHGHGEDAFFGLRAQVESLLRREAFPRLRYVRDLSEGSDAMRRGKAGLNPPPRVDLHAHAHHAHLAHAHARERARDVRERERVVKFWEGVLGRCREEGVWLEDWRGWNVTRGGLRRARVGLGLEDE
ncbi:hypothetical protein K438DRAFT_1807816 [Mycena galopus ATCC 62051]|nr:hypothetical protein K438DRAFT_1807816 [Mycena galopus ATCC 62051]